MRKEYNDRWNAPLVNHPITHGEYEERKRQEATAAVQTTQQETPITWNEVLKTHFQSQRCQIA